MQAVRDNLAAKMEHIKELLWLRRKSHQNRSQAFCWAMRWDDRAHAPAHKELK